MVHDTKNVSRETFSKLGSYVGLLHKWNSKINLIGRTTESEIWQRHIEDSLQLLNLIPATVTTLADLGSGAGLPGLVIAIAKPQLSITLIEIDQRKSAFLNEAARGLGLSNVTIQTIDIHSLHQQFDAITARALAPLDQLCAMAYPRLAKNAICLFPKGENFASEVKHAGDKWNFRYTLTPSKTHEKACIISVSELTPKA